MECKGEEEAREGGRSAAAANAPGPLTTCLQLHAHEHVLLGHAGQGRQLSLGRGGGAAGPQLHPHGAAGGDVEKEVHSRARLFRLFRGHLLRRPGAGTRQQAAHDGQRGWALPEKLRLLPGAVGRARRVGTNCSECRDVNDDATMVNRAAGRERRGPRCAGGGGAHTSHCGALCPSLRRSLVPHASRRHAPALGSPVALCGGARGRCEQAQPQRPHTAAQHTAAPMPACRAGVRTTSSRNCGGAAAAGAACCPPGPHASASSLHSHAGMPPSW